MKLGGNPVCYFSWVLGKLLIHGEALFFLSSALVVGLSIHNGMHGLGCVAIVSYILLLSQFLNFLGSILWSSMTYRLRLCQIVEVSSLSVGPLKLVCSWASVGSNAFILIFHFLESNKIVGRVLMVRKTMHHPRPFVLKV